MYSNPYLYVYILLNRVLSKTKDLNSSIVSALYAYATLYASEFLPWNFLSAYSLASSIGLSDEGYHYPEGGYDRICDSMIQSIRHSGGRVFKEVPVEEIVIDIKSNGIQYACGVRCRNEGNADDPYITFTAKEKVISGMGYLNTFLSLLSPTVKCKDDTLKLHSQLCESAPIVQIAFYIHGTSADLGLTSCDYIEIGSVPLCTVDTNDTKVPSVANNVGDIVRVWCPTVKDDISKDRSDKIRYRLIFQPFLIKNITNILLYLLLICCDKDHMLLS
jgi:hypothetical protein